MTYRRPKSQVYRASCSLCAYQGAVRSLSLAWVDQERHADSRAHQLAIRERDTA